MHDPSACGECGISKLTHFQRYISGIGWHTWQQPTQQQIKDRMVARRKERAGA